MINKKDTIVIIPAYNEEKSIQLVLSDIPKDRIIEIIVVNNNSTDSTVKKALDQEALVVTETQQGYGAACLKGLKEASQFSPEIIVFLDADYSDHPQEMNLLLEQIDQGNDLVIGCRNLGKAEKGSLLIQAIFGNWLATFLTFHLFGGPRFHDLGPFRAIKTSALDQIKMTDKDFGWTIEMQVKAIVFALKIAQVSVSYRKRIGQSKITGTIKGTILAGKKILQTIFFLKYKLRKESKKSLNDSSL